jgi:hypothetical protein
MRRAVLSGATLILALGAFPAAAQTVIGAKSGVINWVEGDAFLGDKPYAMQPSQFGEVKENMVFRTGEGRAEILLPPGVFFRIGENASFKMISNRLIDTRVDLLTGSAVLEVSDLDKEATLTVLCKDATATIGKTGIYRFDTQPPQIKVFKGSADVAINGQTVSVGAGKMVTLGAVASVEKFDVAGTDSLDRWSHRRAEVVANANISAAKQAHYGNGGYGGNVYGIGSNPCRGYGGYNTGPIIKRAMGTWTYNPWYGFGTYIPCNGRLNSPYGYRFWSPLAVYEAFYAPRPTYTPPPNSGYGTFSSPGYNTMGSSSGGYSGSMSSAPSSVSSSAPAATSSGSSAASSAGSSSVGHGSAGGGGSRGK